MLARIAAIMMMCLTGIAPAVARDLHILSVTDRAAIQPVIDRFEARYPDVTVHYTEMITSDLFQEVLSRGKHPGFGADLVISSAMDMQVKLVNEGYARPANLQYGDALPDWASWRDELFGFTFEPVVVVYNKAAFDGIELPRSRAELARLIRQQPGMFQEKIGTYDIGKSGVGFLFAAQDSIRGNQYFRLIESFGRADTRIFCCTSAILDRVASGELRLGYNVIGSYALAAAAANPDIGILFFQDYSLAMTRTAFIPKTAPSADLAEDFIDFLLSPEGQAIIARDSGLLPINQDINQLLADDSLNIPWMPIRLGPVLLTHLDQLKRQTFLANWFDSINQNRPVPE